ncbi:uncharacterized protein LAJ45_11098 [Morchella importuna]|uniref:uncharacterized protein n=1 Tax=Morchella importuna TaxID=1174673 RepID=UPI001E8EC8F4|nr:uncharacterized protein LAJ45_11098 [Morchella importuna]KAH8144892.1 hypothetical protein LAJ45_11098 [Morchella importuna]
MRFPFAPLLALTAATAVAAHRRLLTIPGPRADSDPKVIAAEHLKTIVPNVEFRENGDDYTDVDTGITHVYFTQTLNGLDIENAQANINIKRDGSILSMGLSFVTEGLDVPAPVRRQTLLSPLEALKGIVEKMDLPLNVVAAEAVPESSLVGGGQSFTIMGSEGAVSEPRADLTYYQTSEGIKLVWRKGSIIAVADYVADASYNVYPIGVNDPTDGARTAVTNPASNFASPNGWHTAGSTSYITTRGNNGIAQENWDAGSDYLNNQRPSSSGSSLNFNFEYSPSDDSPKDYIDAAVTQLFYTANAYHDLLEVLGFTEVAGNFEDVNTGAGGRGNDAVQLNAQDGSGFNNANMATPADGSRPRMRMYLWNVVPGVQRDGDFDNGVIIHEYTHGLSNRLTGGPSRSTCLSTTESGGLGEGWGDFYATAIRVKPNDTRTKDYAMGDWVNGAGIRRYPYSTSMTTNPTTYATINLSNWNALVHAIGSVWANILYEAMWNLEDKWGYQKEVMPTFRAGTSIPTTGRHLMMKLVLEGMKLQPCSPTFLTARDAILDADRALTGGENLCELWSAFSKRGLGASAKQGTGSNARVESFDMPTDISC